jgi:hypothetical protein
MKCQRLTAIFLCLLFFYVTTGYYAHFYYRQFQVKQLASEITCSLHETKALLLTSAEFSSLVWEDHKEIIYKGEYYDVVDVVRENGQYKINCYHDVEELHLVSTLKDHFRQVLPATSSSKSKCEIRFLFFGSLSDFKKVVFDNMHSLPVVHALYLNKTTAVCVPFPTPPPERYTA